MPGQNGDGPQGQNRVIPSVVSLDCAPDKGHASHQLFAQEGRQVQLMDKGGGAAHDVEQVVLHTARGVLIPECLAGNPFGLPVVGRSRVSQLQVHKTDSSFVI